MTSILKKYRKKPVVIDAIQLDAQNMGPLVEQMKKEGHEVRTHSEPPMRAITGIAIKTLEGTMIGNIGDYIIKGVQGEYYPCKPDIFEKTYDKVDEDNGE